MVKRIFYIIILIIALSLGSIIIYNHLSNDKRVEKEKEKETIDEKVNHLLKELTLEEKIAQMLIVYYSSGNYDDNLNRVLTENKPGGFILFKDNITSYDKTVELIKNIKSTAKIPMFIAIDQEGGIVQRIKKLDDVEATTIPDMLKLGETKDVELSHDVGKVIAEELRAFGINMDFAPVIDIVSNPKNNVIGNRSFGSDKKVVADMGISLAKGLEDNGVIPVFKHFPGHGSTTVDSHYYLPIISKTKEELIKNDLVPFQAAIDKGAKVIMVGHLAIPEITGDDTPASLSKTLITDLLKDEMGYTGLVVTDALNMKAITDNYEEQEIYEKAINAGVDLLLMPKTSTSAIELISDSIKKGTIREEQIDSSVEKILKLKYEKLDKNDQLDKSVLGSDEHQKIMMRIKGD